MAKHQKGINRDIQRREHQQTSERPHKFSVEYYDEAVTKEVTPTMRDLVRKAYTKPKQSHEARSNKNNEE